MDSQKPTDQETTHHQILYSKIETFITGGYVIGVVSILFFPAYLLGALLYCVCGPTTWGDVSHLSEETKTLIKKGYSNITLLAAIGFFVWMIISIFLMFFLVGFLTLALALVCFIVFMVFVPIPLSNLHKKQTSIPQV